MQPVLAGVSGSEAGTAQEKARQQPILLPTNALAEIFSFLPQSDRARLALLSSQTPDAILPGVDAERKKVPSPVLLLSAPIITTLSQFQVVAAAPTILQECHQRWEDVNQRQWAMDHRQDVNSSARPSSTAWWTPALPCWPPASRVCTVGTECC